MRLFLQPRWMVIAPAALLLLAGCIEFESQTLSYRYDAKSDTIHIFQDYHGIFGEAASADDPNAPLTQREIDQLASVWTTERTFFFSNWIVELNLAETRDKLADASDVAENPLERTVDERMRGLMQLFLANTRISDGPYYLDADGHLCGVQRVTITHVTDIVAAGNELIRAMLQVEAQNSDRPAVMKALYARAATATKPFIEIEGNRITVRYPMLADDYEKALAEAKTDDKDDLARLTAAGVRVSFAEEWMTASFGRTDSTFEELTMPFSVKPYRPTALEHVREHYGIATAFDPKGARDAFLQVP
jgi:hypothetical protein